jgi:hypothetical protein
VSRTVSTYQWKFNGVNIPNSNSANWSDTREGDYQVVVTDGNNCQATSTDVPVTYSPAVPSLLQPAYEVCPDDGAFVKLTPGQNPDDFQSYTWYLNGKHETDHDDSASYRVNTAGLYHVDLVDKFGCEGSDETNVIVSCKPYLDAPTAFRPGSNIDKNNFFEVFGRHVADEGFQIFIFNRWGEMVYQNTDLHFQWNGKDAANITLLPPGVYSWVAKFKGDSPQQSESREKHGGVVLLR